MIYELKLKYFTVAKKIFFPSVVVEIKIPIGCLWLPYQLKMYADQMGTISFTKKQTKKNASLRKKVRE